MESCCIGRGDGLCVGFRVADSAYLCSLLYVIIAAINIVITSTK